MRKLITLTALLCAVVGVVYAAQEELSHVASYTVPALVDEINDEIDNAESNFDELYAADTATTLITDRITLRTGDEPDFIVFREKTNGINYITVKPTSTLATNYTVTLPASDVDLGTIIAGGVLPAVSLASATNLSNSGIAADAGIVSTKLHTDVQTSLGLADTALQPITWTVGVVTSSLSAKVTLTSSQSAAQFITGWISEESGGSGVGTNSTSMVIDSAGVLIAGGGDEDAYGIFTTHTDGTAVFDVTIKAAQAGLYFNVVQNNNVVVSQTFDITQD